MTCALCLCACRTDPGLEPDSSTEATSDDTDTEATSDNTDTQDTQDTEDTLMDIPPPDMGGGQPSSCEDHEGSLEFAWGEMDEALVESGAVALGDGVLAWVANGFQELVVRVHDTDGNLLWSDTMPGFWTGSSGTTLSDVQIAEDGTVVVSSTVPGDAYSVLMRWYDPEGELLEETEWTDPGFDFNYGGLTTLEGRDLILAGHAQDQLFLARYDFEAPAEPIWTAGFDEGGANWASDVELGESGDLFVTGHSNTEPAPVVLSYSAEGELLWDYAYPAPGGPGSSMIAQALSLDLEGRLLIASEYSVEGSVPYAGRVDRMTADGGEPSTLLELDYFAMDVEVDPNGRLVVGGARPGENMIIVRRYEPDGTLVSEYTRTGRWAHDLELDEQCGVYVVGDNDQGAWLDKLQ